LRKIFQLLNDISKQYTEYLARIFSANENDFSKATFQTRIAVDYQPTYKVVIGKSYFTNKGIAFVIEKCKIFAFKKRGSGLKASSGLIY